MPCTPRLSIFQDAFVVLGIVCCDGVDGVLILVEQIAHAVALVQGVELFLGHLLELFDKHDNVMVLALACVIGVECDLFELFNGVFLVIALRTPFRITHGFGPVGILNPCYFGSGIVDNIEPVIPT